MGFFRLSLMSVLFFLMGAVSVAANECESLRLCRASWCGEEAYNRCMSGESMSSITGVGDDESSSDREQECGHLRVCRASWCGEESYSRCMNGESLQSITGFNLNDESSQNAAEECGYLRVCRASFCGEEAYAACIAQHAVNSINRSPCEGGTLSGRRMQCPEGNYIRENRAEEIGRFVQRDEAAPVNNVGRFRAVTNE